MLEGGGSERISWLGSHKNHFGGPKPIFRHTEGRAESRVGLDAFGTSALTFGPPGADLRERSAESNDVLTSCSAFCMLQNVIVVPCFGDFSSMGAEELPCCSAFPKKISQRTRCEVVSF